ncbi:Tat (twin-arginine translocation) pathway signal sequence domain protein [Plesiocystis pacifica SIR-1]|uniref:Tat (Twin-arginine translocation) pathway signal sequence domain protein n=1 Tax=Plesiocystis pacifica SIR-1 TaxID=391625 RepID=A6GKJ7_9BACT|nr:DUF1552 domain-containing protein [Plesiocystis pacifica]EDM73606.1 Tat (twin-arginine translocation) pathway signal sequence domain protein [Plesiocystis pacifica SIR-1]
MPKQFSRRGLLSAGAVTLASSALLPMISRRALADSEGVKRVVFWYAVEGTMGSRFWPGTGPGPLEINMAATMGNQPNSKSSTINGYRSAEHGTYILQPMKAHEADITLVSGLSTDMGSGDPHARAVDAIMTGGTTSAGSIDQHLGYHLQGEAPFHAIYSSLMGEHVNANIASYAGPLHTIGGSVIAPTWNPVTTYNQVFPGGITNEEPDPSANHAFESRLAVLGSVREQLEAVQDQGGAEARRRMEAYLESIETIEGQTEALLDVEVEVPPDLSVDVPEQWLDIDPNNKYWRNSQNFAALGKIMMDTTVASLALDRTRVATMHWSASGTDKGPADGQHYTHLGLGLEGPVVADHEMSHNGDWNVRRNQTRVFRWYYEQLAYFVDRLKSIPDGDGTLFDSTVIVVCSEFGGYNHSYNDVPCVLIGNAGGSFDTGKYIDVHNGGFRPYANLMLSLAEGLGAPLQSFGESDGKVNGILA